jgi:hypothetical protein
MTTATDNYTLPCGCVPGVNNCDEATKLWEAVERAFWNERAKPYSDRREYDRELTRFWNHFYQDLTVEGN